MFRKLAGELFMVETMPDVREEDPFRLKFLYQFQNFVKPHVRRMRIVA